MKHRLATLADCDLLAKLNQELIHDEGDRNPMTLPELTGRMHDWLASEYTGVLFQQGGETVAYALYWGNPHEIYLRHLYVIRNRRREGIGRQVMHILRDQIWPSDVRLTVEVLLRNTVALAFWRAMGYQDFSMKLEILPKQP